MLSDRLSRSSPSRFHPAARPTDVRVHDAEADFTDIALEPPFVISGRPLTHVTMARVHLEVRSADGTTARGTGASMLSVPWAWPGAASDVQARDGVLRSLVRRFTDQVLDTADTGDPFALWRPIYANLDETLVQAAREAGVATIPRLAGLLALGAADNAIHDAWSRAAHRSAYSMYTADHLRDDVSWVAPELTGVYPGDHLGAPRSVIPIQHALGVGDPLTDAEAAPGIRSLEQWIRDEGIRHLKLKLAGDPQADARRIEAVHEIADRLPSPATLSLDPNESYEPEQLGRMLDELIGTSPGAAEAITYLEQPFSRERTPDPAQMARLTARFPVLMDEGYSRLEQLPQLRGQGWSGVVIKASKGQSHALVTHAVAHGLGLTVAIQDLTAVDLALEHSIGLAATLRADWPQVEYNSRQFAARANASLAARSPDLVKVRDGAVRFAREAAGSYGGRNPPRPSI